MATKKSGTSGRSTAAKKTSTTQSSDDKSSDATEATATKSPAKKSAAKKSAAKKSPAKRSAPRASAPKRASGVSVSAGAARQLLELTGRQAEGVTGLERTDEGWRVEVEVVEVRRIPDTTDVLALYEVTLDEDGELEGYRRLRRYGRGTPGQES
jgi:hypothetical protein